MRGRPHGFLLSTAGAALALAVSASTVTASVFPYGTIVFVSTRDYYPTAGSDIYTMNPDGTMVTRLTNDALTENDPVLSPDGSKLAYEVAGHIWIQEMTGGTPVDLLEGCVPQVHDACTAREPAWSPDGTKIAYVHVPDALIYELRTIRLADGADQLITWTFGQYTDRHEFADPAWSPNGENIAFVYIDAGVPTVQIKDLDGGIRTLVTGSQPAWSPDGNFIAYVDDLWTHGAYPHPAQNGLDIYVVPACDYCSGDPFPPSMSYGRDLHPSWSPDGTKLLFESEGWDMTTATGDGVFHLYMVDVFPWDDPYPGYVFPDLDMTVFSGVKTGQTLPITYSDTLASWHWPLYDLSGLFSPVHDWNGVKAGSAVPIKFSLGGDQGLDIFASGYPLSVPISCGSDATTGEAVETVNAGGSSLTYDASAGQYVYVWKTDKKWAAGCRQLRIQFKDGTFVTADFSFRR